MIKTIAINATCINQINSGAKNRFVNIYSCLFQLMKNVHFYIFEPSDYQFRKDFKVYKNVTFISTPIPSYGRIRKFFISFFFFNKIKKYYPFDIFESLYLPIFKYPGSINILTIHDIRGFDFEKNKIYKLFNYLAIKYYILKCDYIFAVSNYIKNRINIVFKIKKKKINVFYNSIPKKKISKKNHFKFKNYILSIGHFEKRKNFENLIKAFFLIKKKEKLKLIIIGNTSGNQKYFFVIKKLIKKLSLENDVVILSNLTDNQIIQAYKNAKLFVYPSLYEGFGIPIIEAMKYKTPLAASNLEVFKEITSKNCFYFNPNDFKSIYRVAINTLQDNKKRKKLQNFYVKRIKIFENYKIAKEIKNFYKKIGNL